MIEVADTKHLPTLNRFDKAIAWAFPGWAAQRMGARMAMRDAAMLRASYRSGMETRLDSGSPTSFGLRRINDPNGISGLTSIRARSRNLDESNCLAESLFDRAQENVVGTGMRVQARTTDSTWNKLAESRFSRWCNECDVRELQDFYTIQQMLYRTMLRDGDICTLLVSRGGFPMLQPMEGDMLDSPPGKSVLDRTIDGITFNPTGAPRTFYFKKGDVYSTEYEAIPARDVIYLMRQKRFSATRGKPVLAGNFWLFDNFEGYLEATVTAARAGACQALLVKKKQASSTYSSIQNTATNARGNAQKSLMVEPMMIHYLAPDEDVQGFNPTQPTQSFPEFIAALCRIMGLNLGLTLEQVMLDFSRTNYSSSRAARLQAEATANSERGYFVNRFLRRLWQWWTSRMIDIGELPEPTDPNWWTHEWVSDAKPWVDPEKEIKAALIELDMGLTTLTILAKERGREFAELVEQRREEMLMLDDAEIPQVMSIGTREPGANIAQPPDQTQPEPQPTDTENQ